MTMQWPSAPGDALLRFMTRGRLSVFLFHAVPRRAPDLPPDIDLQQFASVLGFIRSHFTVLPLDQAVQAMQRGRIPPRAACLTFDDGYASWMDGVVPMLERDNLHATFYITTGQLHGLPMWHERLAHVVLALPGPQVNMPWLGLPSLPLQGVPERRQVFGLLEQFLKYQPLDMREGILQRLEKMAGVQAQQVPSMSVPQLKTLAAKGFGIGAHTHSHPILALCGARAAQREIGAVRESLSALVGTPVQSFAYPNGRPLTDYHADHVAMVRAAGYAHAVTTDWGAATARTSVYEIPRFTPWGPSQQRMAMQVVRNLVTRPKSVGQNPRRPTRALVVENGAGFGGAVIALRTLLAGFTAQEVEAHLALNLSVGNFAGLPAVRTCRVIADRLWDARETARRIRQWPVPAALQRALLFGLGRADDLFNRLPYLLRLGWHALRLRPDVVHGNNEPNSNREAMLVAKLLRIPYVQHLRGPVNASGMTPWLYAGPSAFIAVSRWLAADLLTQGVAGARVRQIYDGVDMTAPPSATPDGGAPDVRQQLGLPPHTVLVAMVGMLVPWKGQDLFLQAVAQLQAQHRTQGQAQSQVPVAFLVVGGTPERGDAQYAQQLQAQARALGVQQQVHFMGKRGDLAHWLAQLDVVVSASTLPEPLGLVMIEAMSSGCLFVAPAFGAATEVVVDGQNGFLFEPCSAASLAGKLAQAIAQVQQVQQTAEHSPQQAMLAQARASVQDIFSPARCCQHTLMVYRTVTG